MLFLRCNIEISNEGKEFPSLDVLRPWKKDIQSVCDFDYIGYALSQREFEVRIHMLFKTC